MSEIFKIQKQLDNDRFAVWKAVKKNPSIIYDIAFALNIKESRVRNIIRTLIRDHYVHAVREYYRSYNRIMNVYHITDREYFKMTDKQIEQKVNDVYERRDTRTSNTKALKSKFDDIINSNPNLKTYRLFDNPPTEDYFKQKAKKSQHTGIASTFAMFDLSS